MYFILTFDVPVSDSLHLQNTEYLEKLKGYVGQVFWNFGPASEPVVTVVTSIHQPPFQGFS